MGVFFAVLLILAALILLYILWCLAEPFFLVNDKVSLKRTELTGGEISKETVKKLPFVPGGSESSPDLRIFFFSDIHTEWCPVTAKRLCKSIKRAHEASGLDAVIFGGDIITYPENAAKGYKYLIKVSEFCKELGIPFYGISGNHDCRLTDAPEKSGFISLDSKVFTLTSRKNGAKVYLTGVPDSGKLQRVWQEKLATGSEYPVILAAHDPDALLHLSPASRPSYMLSGHFHGGQMKLPFKFEFNVLRTTDKFPKMGVIQGHFNINGTEVFISRGVGCGILPFRIFSAPEATVVEICL
jgi:hypothetical protein